MGTNFYLRDETGTHIGKRSAAGYYCYDCGITLTHSAPSRGFHFDWRGKPQEKVYGQDAVHHGSGEDGTFKACPLCGAEPTIETVSQGAIGRELGFNKEPPSRKTGVRSCASFTFAWYPSDFRKTVLALGVRDEYDREYTGEEFLRMLALDCPIRYWRSVGAAFS